LRPETTFSAAAFNAVRTGWRAAISNLPSILALQVAMAAIVATYYLWPAAEWQGRGGFLANGLALAIAGGVLSQLCLVYVQQRGRWTRTNVENLIFNFVAFFISGCIIYEFYRMQAVWWGNGARLSIIVPKVLVDQFGYTVFFGAPYYALLTRWHALHYSGARLWRELNRDFVTELLLPILVANWMFWIPAVSFVYAMPQVLQAPLGVFATAIWGLLITTVSSRRTAPAPIPVTIANPPLVATPAK
jgi:hypothetical protein